MYIHTALSQGQRGEPAECGYRVATRLRLGKRVARLSPARTTGVCAALRWGLTPYSSFRTTYRYIARGTPRIKVTGARPALTVRNSQPTCDI